MLSFFEIPPFEWRLWDAKIRNFTSDFKGKGTRHATGEVSGALAASFFSAFGTVVQKMKQIKHQTSGWMEPKRGKRREENRYPPDHGK